jgi:hypothetical protein
VAVVVCAANCDIPAAPKKAAIITTLTTDLRLAIGQYVTGPRDHTEERLVTMFFIINRMPTCEVIIVYQPTGSGVVLPAFLVEPIKITPAQISGGSQYFRKIRILV